MIKEEVFIKKIYYDGLAKKVALDEYHVQSNDLSEDTEIFERLGIWNQIEKLCQKRYYMRNGAYLILEQTSSFFAIDVNSGKDLKIALNELNLLACDKSVAL